MDVPSCYSGLVQALLLYTIGHQINTFKAVQIREWDVRDEGTLNVLTKGRLAAPVVSRNSLCGKGHPFWHNLQIRA
jgi:hypothetical protein